MVEIVNQIEPVTFGLVHGAHHSATAWNKLCPILENFGHKTVVMDLPIDELDVDLDTYAHCIADSLRGHNNVAIVGHSRMGKAISRVPALIGISRLIYLNAVIKPAANQLAARANQPQAIDSEYTAGRIPIPGTPFVEYDKSKAMVFVSDFDADSPEIEASKEEVEDILYHLRKQNRADDAEPLESQPDVPTSYIISTEDKVVRPEYSRYAAKHYLNVHPVEIPGGHSAFLLRPTLLATVLNEIVTQS